MALREFLISQYQHQGWTVCCDSSESNTVRPKGWTGSFPDIVAVKGSQKLAICIETPESLTGDTITKKWKSILGNAGYSLLVVVRDKKTCGLATRTAKKIGVSIDCRIMKRVNRQKGRPDSIFKRRAQLFSLVAGLLFAFVMFFLVFPSARTSVQEQFLKQIAQTYQPKKADQQQFDSLRKEMERMMKK